MGIDNPREMCHTVRVNEQILRVAQSVDGGVTEFAWDRTLFYVILGSRSPEVRETCKEC